MGGPWKRKSAVSNCAHQTPGCEQGQGSLRRTVLRSQSTALPGFFLTCDWNLSPPHTAQAPHRPS